MVSRKTYIFVVEPNAMRKIAVAAACINAGLPILKENDRFSGVRIVPRDLARFLEAAEEAQPMVVQCGVWALTDNMSGFDVTTRCSHRIDLATASRPSRRPMQPRPKAFWTNLVSEIACEPARTFCAGHFHIEHTHTSIPRLCGLHADCFAQTLSPGSLGT